MKAIAIGWVVLSMAGWISHHVAPPDTPTATLTLSTGPMPHGSYMFVQAFANDACGKHPDGTRLAFFGTKRLQGKSDPHDGVERAIRADHPIVVSFFHQEGAPGLTDSARCVVTRGFMPKAGARYRGRIDITEHHCIVAIEREDGDDPGAVDGLHPVEPACHDSLRG
jgi:hypothetical protein